MPQADQANHIISEELPVPYKVTMLLDYPSPHMEDLLQAFARMPGISLHVYYNMRRNPFRAWTVHPSGYRFEFGTGVEFKYCGVDHNEAFSLDIRTLLGFSKKKYDIVVCCARITNPNSQMAMLNCWIKGQCWAYMNEPLGINKNKGWKKMLRRALSYMPLRHSWGIIGMGALAAKQYRHMTSNRVPVFNVPYATNLQRFTSVCRQNNCAVGTTCRYLFVGQLITRKRLDLMLNALAIAGLQKAAVTIVGDGPERFGLQEMVKRLGLLNVDFVGHVPYDQVYKYFMNSDVLVMPSDHDGWGMVVVEALASGLAVIASSRVGAACHLVRNGENGYLFPRNDAPSLAALLRRLWDEPLLLYEMKLKAAQSVKDFTPESIAGYLYCAVSDIVQRYNRKHHGSKGIFTSDIKAELRVIDEGIFKSLRRVLRNNYLSLAGSVATSRNVKKHGVRILVYHHFSEGHLKGFSEQLSFLIDNFNVVSLGTAIAMLDGGQINESTVVITLDDAFKGQFTLAAPLLSKYNIHACFYLPAGFVLLKEEEELKRLHYAKSIFHLRKVAENMNVVDINMLISEGHEMGSHGLTHLSLEKMQQSHLEMEIGQSKKILEEKIHSQVIHFSYPYGKHNQNAPLLKEILQKAGYKSAVTLERGINNHSTDPYFLRRDHVEADWPLSHLRYFLSRE